MTDNNRSYDNQPDADRKNQPAATTNPGQGFLSSPVTIVILASVLTIGLLMAMGWQVWQSYLDHKNTQEQVFPIQVMKGQIIHFDEVLTMSTNMAAATGDRQWEIRYRHFEPQLDVAIKTLRKLVPETFDTDAAIQTDKANVKLVEMENQVFELVASDRLEQAQKIISGQEYRKQKDLYSNGMQRIAEDLENYINQDLQTHRKKAMSAVISTLLGMSLLAILWLWVLKNMRRHLNQRNLAEQALMESEDRFRDFFANAPIGFHIFGPDQVITDINDAELDMIGYTRDEIIGKKTWADLVIPAQTQQFKNNWSNITTKGDIHNLEYTLIHKQGRHIDVLLSASSRFDKTGQFINSRGSTLNITDRKQAAKERERLLKTLAAKNEELQSIIYVVSHDLKSPLVNIQGFSQELENNCKETVNILRDIDLDPETKQRIMAFTQNDIPESLNFISAGADKIKLLLDGLLQVSRVGSMLVNIEPLNVNDIINNVCQSMEFQLKEKDAKVEFQDLPDCLGDAKMIDQLFSNLIGNALKYLAPDKEPKIRITAAVENSQSIYCVEDNGIGINAQYLKKIFKLFHRLNPDENVEGQGIGLTIVTRILDRTNGNISVESEEGKGSKFYVALPTA